MDPIYLIVLVVLSALIFDFMNGWNDSANAIATVVSTRVMSPMSAVALAAVLNFAGALVSTKIAKTIGGGVVDLPISLQSEYVVLGAMISASIWVAWCTIAGLPISGSHSLIGGLVGAAVGLHGFNILKWNGVTKILLALMLSPLLGLIVGFVLLTLVYACAIKFNSDKTRSTFISIVLSIIGLVIGVLLILLFANMLTPEQILSFAKTCLKSTFIWFVTPILIIAIAAIFISKGMSQSRARRVFGFLQICSCSFMAFQHGKNDAQKIMGVITLALLVGGLLPGAQTIDDIYVPLWVMIACGIAIAIGTAAGGWKVIKTMGMKLAHLTPTDGFAAEIGAGVVLESAAELGIPVSTTHTITGSIIGVGAAKNITAVKWGLGAKIVYAWLLTLPVCFFLGAIFSIAIIKLGVIPVVATTLAITAVVLLRKYF